MDFEKDFEDRKIELALGQIHYKYHKGTGKNLIFLHGMGGNVSSWKRLVGFLPSFYNVYLVDLLGHGESAAPRIDYTIESQVMILVEFIDECGIENPYLFGNSYGGWIAAEYAMEFKVSGMVLEDCAGLKESFDEIINAKGEQEYRKYFMEEAMKIDGNRDYVIGSILDRNLKGEELTAENLAMIETPTLIIWGSKDQIVNPKDAALFQKRIRGSRLQMIDGAGHLPHVSHPKEVSDALQAFLGDI